MRSAARIATAVVMAITAGCTTTRPQPITTSSCPEIPPEIWAAGDLPDGLPDDPAAAVLAMYRAWAEARAALAQTRAILDAATPAAGPAPRSAVRAP